MLISKKDEREKRGASQDGIIAFLGKGTRYEGTVGLGAPGGGEIGAGGALVVGEGAVIDAEVSVGSVVCGGTINGNITATEKVHLLTPAVVTGSIKAPIIMIEAGVRFNGQGGMKGEPRGKSAIEFEERRARGAQD